MYQQIYCLAYFGLSATLVVWLARMLRRSGSIFLRDAFQDRSEVVRALGHLLEIGYYLICTGFVAISFPDFLPLHNPLELTLMISSKLGGFLLLLGFMHFLNVLILAIIRQRSLRIARAGELR